MPLGQIIYDTAEADIGTWEWAGADNNPKVMQYYRDAGHPEIKEDATPWCAAFVGAVLAKLGLPNTGSLLARSYLEWGTEVPLSNAEQGDVVILKRGNSSWQGHVGFYAGQTAQHVKVLGGNQSDQVNISNYHKSKLLGVRRVSEGEGGDQLLRDVADAGLKSKTNWAAGGLAGAVTAALTFLKDESDLIKIMVLIMTFLLVGYIVYSRNSKAKRAKTLL